MGTRPGIVWGRGNAALPSDLAAVLTTYSEQLSEDEMHEILNRLLEDAVTDMERAIDTRGVRNGVPNNEGRNRTEAMRRSASFDVRGGAADRMRAEFGYIINPPKWALWQEYGTYGGQNNGQGILAMLALTDAYARFRSRLENALRRAATPTTRQTSEGAYNYGSSPPVRGYRRRA